MKIGLKVGEIMTTKPLIVSPDDTIQACAKKMTKNDVSSVIVRDENKLLGVVTEADFVEKVIVKSFDVKKAVSEIMTKDVVTIAPDRDVYDALMLMKDKNFRRLPVVENGILLGLITVKDILKVEPQLFELIIEMIELREEERKFKTYHDKILDDPNMMIKTESDEQGFCEICGNYSDELVLDSGGMRICHICKEEKAWK